RRDRHRVPVRGALEEQVLQEVGGAVVTVGLVTRADGHPGAERGRALTGHRLGQHPDTAREHRAAHLGAGTGVHLPLYARCSRRVPTGNSGPDGPVGPTGSDGTGAQASVVAGSSVTTCRESLPRSAISASSTATLWPTESTSSTLSMRLPPTSCRIWEMCSRPS